MSRGASAGRSATPPEAPGGHRATLAQQLRQAARCVQAVQAGRSLTDVLPTVPGPLRPGVQALTFHALRHLGTVAALVGLLAEKDPPAPTRALLCVSLSLLMPAAANAQEVIGPQYEPFTVVDQAVDAVRSVHATAHHAAMVNACLRRYLRERDDLMAQVNADWEARYNHPAWWVKRVRRDHPLHWQAILAASQVPAPLVLRVNTAHLSRDGYLAHLAEVGLQAHAVGASGVRLTRHVGVEGLPGYEQGWFSVQDTAAQLAAPLLLDGLSAAADRPLRVLDACAAPGGKTAHLLERAHERGLAVDVLALEVDARRSQRITENLTRLRLPVPAAAPPTSAAQVKVADASALSAWWDGELFDAILLDAPCTASGIVRRHPDVRWLRRETDVAALAATQARLLDALWPLLRHGGRMVYCTCSVFRAEGQTQVDAFVARHTDVRTGPAPGHLLPGVAGGSALMTDNAGGENDGFFYTCLDKLGG